MKKLVIAFFLLAVLLEAKAYGKLTRHQPARVEMQITAPTETPAPPPQDVAPLCVLDWSLPLTDDNSRALLSCYKARRAAGVIELFCAPIGSVWENYTNNSECWASKYGTPAALTATAMPPSSTPTPPAYP